MTLLKWLMLSLVAGAAQSCQNIRIRAADGSMAVGRSMEFSEFDDATVLNYVVSEPAGTVHKMPDLNKCATAVTFNSLYKLARLRAEFDGSWANTTLGGINSAGLSGSTLYFTGKASFQSPDRISGRRCTNAIPQTAVTLWVLSRYSSVGAIREALRGHGNNPFPYVYNQGDLGMDTIPIHFAFYDTTGDSMVLEYTSQGRKEYRNDLGVMTNSPEYSWHMDNIKLYPNIRDKNWEGFAWQYKGTEYLEEPLWTGNGLSGIPGDFSSPSRFIRAAAQVTAIPPPANADDAILTVLHLLNAGDITKGIALAHGLYDFTWYTVVYDLSRQCVIYRGYTNLSIKRVCLDGTSHVSPAQFLIDDGDFNAGIQDQ